MRAMARTITEAPTPAEALRLFMTAPRSPMARREAEQMAHGTPFEFEQAGDRLRGWIFGEGPLVLLTHGWGGRASQLADFAVGLANRGRKVICFDAPGHGESEGEICNAVRVADCLAILQNKFGPVEAILGYSFGVVGANVALWNGLQVKAVAYISGLVWIPERFKEWAHAVGLSPDAEAEYLQLAEDYFGKGKIDQISGDRIAPAMTAAALIVHDEADAEVDIEQAECLARNWPQSQVVKTVGLGHRRTIRSSEVINRVVDFIVNSGQPEAAAATS